jgi:GntR family transcriptional regulator/MocR family aminotransferase
LQKQLDFLSTLFSFIINKEFSEAKYELNDGQPDLRPSHNFQNGGASMKRKSLISKWNQNKKQGILYLKTNCNYLNATRTSNQKT